jgi:hypothetical protein
MRRLTKLLAVVLAAGFLVTMLGCSNGEQSNQTDAGDGQDAWQDNEPDAGSPDGADDTGGDEYPAVCPGPELYSGDQEWTGTLEVSPDECLLVYSLEGLTIPDALSAKAIIRHAPGSYPLPNSAGDYTLRLPLCVFTEPDSPPLQVDATGQVTVETSGDAIWMYHDQILVDDSGGEWLTEASISGEGGILGLNTAQLRHELSSTHLFLNTFRYHERFRHTLNFSGGQLISDFFVNGRTPSSGLLVRASGVLDGIAFEQASYWRLIASQYHHFWGADWAVLFDTPVGSACGLRVEAGNPAYPEAVSLDTKVYTIDCDFSNLEERAFGSQENTAFELERSPCPY